MANRIPLIVNAGAGQIQELATGDTLSVVGNIATGNILTNGYYYANGTPVTFGSSANLLAVTTDIIPSGNNTQSLGNATNQWQDIYVSNATIYFDSIPLTVNGNSELLFDGNAVITAGAGNTLSANSIAVSGNVNAANISVSGTVTANSFATTGNGGNITGANVVFANTFVSGTLSSNTAGISQLQNEDLYITVQDQDDDGWAVYNQVGDGTGNILGVTRLQKNEYNIQFLGTSKYFQFTDAGNVILPGNIVGPYGETMSIEMPGAAANSTITIKTVDNTSTLRSNVTVGVDNVYVSTGNALNTWGFDNTGALNFPRDVAGNTDPYLTITGGSDPSITSNDVSLAGPANLSIVSNLAIFSGFNGNTVSIYADDGDIGGSNNIHIYSNTAGNTYGWTFGANGNLTLPGNTFAVNYANGTPVSISGGSGNATALVNGTNSFSLDNTGQAILTLANTSGNIGTIQSISGAPDLLVDALTGNVVIAANDNREWKFDTIGSLTLPTLALTDGDERTIIQSQRKIIPPNRWSAVIDGATPTIVYSATDSSITSMKVTMQIQHVGQGMEFFEVFATFVGSTDTYYAVSNRVAPPGIEDSTVVVGLNGSTNAMEITVTVNSGATTSWVTYDAVEFGIPND